jgi:uncharacterized RDD family membrane protein YckC
VSENPPGWYKDPAEPTTQRYWDGEGWIGEPLPVDATPPPGPPRGATSPRRDAPTRAAVIARPTETGSSPMYPRPTAAPPVPAPVGQPPGPGAGVPPPPGWPPGLPYPGPYVIEVRPHGYALAPLGRRLVARLIDIAMVLVLSSIANSLFLYQYIRQLAPYLSAIRKYAETNDQSALNALPTNDTRASTLLLVITVVLMAVWLAYEVPFIAKTGQTLGKRVMGIRVIPLEGVHPLGVARALRRWSTLGLPTLLWTCGVGFIMQFIASLSPVLNRPLRLAMHDRAAATVVVNAAGPIGPPTALPVVDRRRGGKP